VSCGQKGARTGAAAGTALRACERAHPRAPRTRAARAAARRRRCRRSGGGSERLSERCCGERARRCTRVIPAWQSPPSSRVSRLSRPAPPAPPRRPVRPPVRPGRGCAWWRPPAALWCSKEQHLRKRTRRTARGETGRRRAGACARGAARRRAGCSCWAQGGWSSRRHPRRATRAASCAVRGRQTGREAGHLARHTDRVRDTILQHARSIGITRLFASCPPSSEQMRPLRHPQGACAAAARPPRG